MHRAFDPNPGHRTESEWRQLLTELLNSLCAFTEIKFAPISWFIEDQSGYASAGGCIDIRGTVNSVLHIEACGVLSASVNFGEAAWVLCDLLLFTDGKRLLGPNQCDLVSLRYTAEGWVNHGWVGDEYHEWESHTSDIRWAQKREDTIIIS